MRTLVVFFLLGLVMVGSPCLAAQSTDTGQTQPKHSFIPKEGFVPNRETAIRIAEAVWIPIYGETQINGEKPFRVTLRNEVWIIEGSLRKGMKGGVAIAEIAKKDGRIIRVSHGK